MSTRATMNDAGGPREVLHAAYPPLTPSYYVLFDEYGAGEARALRDYLSAFGARFEPLLGRKRRPFSRVPGQVFGKIYTC